MAALRTMDHFASFAADDVGDEAFAPIPMKIDMFLEHQGDVRQPWRSWRFQPLGLINPQGPFVQELNVPVVPSGEWRLRMLDWPLYYTLDLPKLALNNQYGTMIKNNGAFRNAVVISGIHSLDPVVFAIVLAAHMAHHMSLGFDLYLVYVRDLRVLKSILDNAVTTKYVDDGSLQVISLDSLQLPSYDDKRMEVDHPFHQSYDSMKLVAYNHASLMLWGERFRMAAIDLDEFWSSHPSHHMVNSWFDTCFPQVDILMSERVNVVCNQVLRQDMTELSYFRHHWNASAPTIILRHFDQIVSFSKDTKTLSWPDKVGQIWIHKPESLNGSNEMYVGIDQTSLEVKHPYGCVFVVHLYNQNTR